MTRQRSGALLIPEEHLEKHRRRFPTFKPLNAQLLFSIRTLAQRINDDTTDHLTDVGLTARQYNYLAVIYVEGEVTPNEIGTLIRTANPTVTSMLKSLERDGLIVREQHPADGRSSVVRLTPRGKRVYEHAFQLHHAAIERTMGALAAEEQRTLVEMLVRLGDAFAGIGTRSTSGKRTR